MSTKTDELFTHNSTKKAARKPHVFLVLFLVVFPLLLAALYTSLRTFRELNDFTLSRRGAIASLAATALKEKFDKIVDVGISLSTRVQFQKLVESGRWDEAIKIMDAVPKNFSYVDTVALFDAKGTLGAVTPLTPEIAPFVGKDFSYRDYYQGVSKNWQSYVSEVFKRAPKPQYNVVGVAIPIKSDRVLGVLLLTIKLDTVVAWSKNIDVGPAGFIYIVDRKGHLAAHPALSSEGDIIDYSSVPAVQKVLEGQRGVEVLFNSIENEERVTAYEPVPGYGWGVVVVQPVRTAFVERNNTVGEIAAIWAFIIFAVGFFTHKLLRDRIVMKAQRDRESTLLESIGDGVVSIDRSWNITTWNKVATDLTGWSKEEALGKPLRDILKFVRESDRKENITFIEETMLFGKVHSMQDHTFIIGRDGREISAGDSAAPVFDQEGKVAGAIIVFRDISKEHQLEESRQEFSSLATHQLRTPVGIIKGYLELLFEGGQGPLTDQQKDSLAKIQQVNERLSTLVNAMLNVLRIESGALAITPEASYIPDLTDEVLKEMLPQIQEKKLRLEKRYAEDIPSVSVDPKLAGAIFRNLLSNAVKYTPEGGKITIKIEKKEQNILIAVSDTGLGIPKEQQAKMFTKFFRGDNVQTKQIEGTGLGLYAVKSILEQSGGNITFTSEENKGATFFVSIPLSGMRKKEGTKGLT